MNETQKRLREIQKDYPELTFNNIGYEYLAPAIRETHKAQMEEIVKLVHDNFDNMITEFNNFKPRKDGSFAIRYQCYYSGEVRLGFIGVHYLNINDCEIKQEVEDD